MEKESRKPAIALLAALACSLALSPGASASPATAGQQAAPLTNQQCRATHTKKRVKRWAWASSASLRFSAVSRRSRSSAMLAICVNCTMSVSSYGVGAAGFLRYMQMVPRTSPSREGIGVLHTDRSP